MERKQNYGDAYGAGFLDYLSGKKDKVFSVHCNIAETDSIPVSYFFRTWKDFPEIEQKALSFCKGRVLDVGAGTGVHSLYLQSQNFDVTAIEMSKGAVEVMQKRGVSKTKHCDFYSLENEKFDTILLLMNGLGVVGRIDNLPVFFEQLKKLLAPGGQIIVDSSDLIYLYQEEDGSCMIDLNGPYYGEVEYKIDYRDIKGESFEWIFIDKGTFANAAEANGFKFELLYEDEHYLYLSRLTLQEK